MKKSVLLILVFYYSGVAAQDNMFLFKLGVGSYSMSTQKLFQKEFHEEIRLPLEVVHEFPAYLSFGSTIGFKVSNNSIAGLWFEYSSTGGRLHYKDYSGEALLDQLLKAYQPGFFYQIKVNKSEKWPIYGTIHGSVAFSKLNLTSALIIGDITDKEELDLKSTNIAIRPGILVQKKITSFVFQAGLGFEIATHGSLKSDDDSISNMYTLSGEEVKVEWDGLRAFVGIGFLINSAPDQNTSQSN